jgi:hypothetical protein
MTAPVRQGWKFLTGAEIALRRDRQRPEKLTLTAISGWRKMRPLRSP